MQNLPLTQDLVLIGGGHTHALVLRSWGMNPLPGARLTLISPGPTTTYSGMLPGVIAGHYAPQALEIDLVRLCRWAGARLIIGAATGIDRVAQTVTVPGRPAVGYDVASIDIGVTSAMPAIPGFAEYGHRAKPLGAFAQAWAAIRTASSPIQIAVIGGGIAGVELTLAMAHALRGRGATLALIDKGQVLSGTGQRARQKLLTALDQAGVTLFEQVKVTAVDPTHITFSDGRQVLSTFTVGAAGATPHRWLANTGLALSGGFLAVDRHLRTSDVSIFAAGDCAEMTTSPRAKAGVFAVRQAPTLLHNLRAALSDGSLRAFRPQRDYLKLVSLGDRSAVAEKWGLMVSGPALWHCKDRIDRRFMARFADLAPMVAPALPRTRAKGMDPAAPPLCGGCGAKVGRGALTETLAALPRTTRPDVLALPGDDAALLLTGGARQVITTDHLSAVTLDPVLMTRIAAIHALGDIWAMGALPQAATISLILPRLSAALQRRTLAEIMVTATEVLTAAGAAIAGGHTTLGDSLTIGFTLTGLCTGDPITISGARAGDALILTKAIGTGVILAADMRGLVKGTTVAACHDAMIRPQDKAAQILSGAQAMTDVTGFGLAGHLANLCSASGLSATLNLAAIPLLPGALDLAAQGVRSSLWADNVAGSGGVTGLNGPMRDLLFDPQTCGGLLAAVPADHAGVLLMALQDTGETAAIIGHLQPGPPQITCL